MRRRTTHLFLLLTLAGVLGSLSACATSRGGDGRPQVVAGFYPLQYVAQRVVGGNARVSNLTAPGVEPHDLELKPRQVADVSGADIVLYEKGLSPAVDGAVKQNAADRALDVTGVVRLRKGTGGPDPHFWLDPTLLARAARAFERAISRRDPKNAAAYARNLQSLERDLAALDRDTRRGLASCRTRTVVVSHDAFEYYGRRYGLDVQPIAGLSPDAEPTARRLSQLAALARDKGVDTVFSERLASRKFADTLAKDLGIGTAVLDPVEGLTSARSGEDYVSLMRANLAALRKAGGCR